jgi:endonuclease/exonuclease/phosphatase family metal-dependent hydrolase
MLLVAILPASGAAQTYVRVSSFNTANFGAPDEYERSLISLVNIIRAMDADIIALQEVEPSPRGRDQVGRLAGLLNKASQYYGTALYEYAIADEHVGDETGAFLWRAPAALLSEIWLLEHESDRDEDGKRAFQRVPFVASFRAGTSTSTW